MLCSHPLRRTRMTFLPHYNKHSILVHLVCFQHVIGHRLPKCALQSRSDAHSASNVQVVIKSHNPRPYTCTVFLPVCNFLFHHTLVIVIYIPLNPIAHFWLHHTAHSVFVHRVFVLTAAKLQLLNYSLSPKPNPKPIPARIAFGIMMWGCFLCVIL